MNYEEVEEFIQDELTFLNLSTKEKEDYVKFIKNLIEHYEICKKTDIDIN